nr:MAG TPA: hypothetical protein [Caudoviricetes sp.]
MNGTGLIPPPNSRNIKSQPNAFAGSNLMKHSD